MREKETIDRSIYPPRFSCIEPKNKNKNSSVLSKQWGSYD